MPRYFFQIRDNDTLIADEEGLELPDTEAALAEAYASAKGMLRDALLNGEKIAHQVIEVSGVDGLPVGKVALRIFEDRKFEEARLDELPNSEKRR